MEETGRRSMKTGSMKLFGGSDEARDRRSSNGRSRDMDNAVFILDVSDGQSFRDFLQARRGSSRSAASRMEGGAAAAPVQADASTPQPPPPISASVDWMNPRSYVFEAGAEPIIAWHPSSLLADLSGLIDDHEFSDITFHFDDGSCDDEAAMMAAEAAAVALRELNDDDNCDSDSEAAESDGNVETSMMASKPQHSTLHAHRLLLSLQNHPIRAMLHSGMREAVSRHVQLHASVGRAAFTAVLAFLYTDSLLFPVFNDMSAADGFDGSDSGDDMAMKTVHMVDAVVASPSPEIVMDILYLANQYTMRRLEVLCEGLLLRLADAQHNAAALYEFADLLNLPNLKTAVRSVAFRDARTWHDLFCQSEGFACLTPSLVSELDRYRTSQNHMYACFQGTEHREMAMREDGEADT